jgi:hypothetical protein
MLIYNNGRIYGVSSARQVTIVPAGSAGLRRTDFECDEAKCSRGRWNVLWTVVDYGAT